MRKKNSIIKGRIRTEFSVCILLLSFLINSCGILPKIDTDPADRTHELQTESASSINDPSQDADSSEPSESQNEPSDVFDGQKKDRRDMEEAFHRFFEVAYEQYVRLEDVDLSDVLDMSSEGCIRFEEDLRAAIEKKKSEIEKDPGVPRPEKLPYQVTIIGTGINGIGASDDQKEGDYLFDLMPLAEQNGYTREQYLDQYPPFMPFGLGNYHLSKINGAWKVDDLDYKDPAGIGYTKTLEKIAALNDYFDELWRQYTKLEYTGLQDVMEEETPEYIETQETLKSCIEEWKNGMELDPERGVPEKPGYELHAFKGKYDADLLVYQKEYSMYGFVLIPTADWKEGMSEEEYLSQYPAFMTFGENNYMLHQIDGKWKIMNLHAREYPEA